MATKTTTRTIKIPVAEVVGSERQELYRDLRQSLQVATRAVNRALCYCYDQDRDSLASDKIQKCPKLYSYPLIKDLFPGVTTVAASLGRTAESHYKAHRFAIWQGREVLPTQRSSAWPVLRSMSTLESDEQGNVLLTFKLLGGRYTVMLRGGSNYRIPLKTLRAACENRDRFRDSKIWIDKKGRIVCGIAVRIDTDSQAKRSQKKLLIKTSRDHLLTMALPQSDKPFVINRDDLHRWVAERDRRYQRLRQDRKSGAARKTINKQLADISARHNRRLRSLVNETAAQAIKFAERRRVTHIEYDDTIRSYTPRFPWHELKQRLQDKCEEVGIAFESVGRQIEEPSLDKPHVYFSLPIDLDGGVNGRIKIGITAAAAGKRQQALQGASGQEHVILAIDCVAKSKLRAREKEYHAMFNEHRISVNGQQTEYFRRGPIEAWLREMGWIGNAGNCSQISQHMEV